MNKLAPMLLVAGLLSGVSSTAFGLQERAADAGAKRAVHSERSLAAETPRKDIEARLAEMKTQLKIMPVQEPQWNAFADVLRRQARAMDETMQNRKPERRDGTAIERLERRQQFLADASVRTNDVLAAAKPLYASFSPEQKKVADDILDRDRQHAQHKRSN